jgi:hypothetical protein
MTVYDSDGNIRFSEHLKSGGATGTSWPEQIASHTESKGIADPRIQSGDRVVFSDASKAPCNGCKGNMNNASAAKNLSIEYYWRDKKGKLRKWVTYPEKARLSIFRRNRTCNRG